MRILSGAGARRAILATVLQLLLACDSAIDPRGPLVTVGDVQVDEIALREYVSKLPRVLQSAEIGEAAVRDLLQALVDRELLLRRARDEGYDQDAEGLGRLHRLRVKKLVQTLLRDEISDSVQVEEETIRKVYEEQFWNRRVRPAHILSSTEEAAWEVVRLLRAGKDFAELARERSKSDKDAGRGGDLLKYFGPEDAASVLVEAAHGLPVGDFSEPIRTADGWEVVKILDAQEVPLAEVWAKLERAIRMRAFMRLSGKLLERLEAKFSVVYPRASVDALLAAGREGRKPTSAEEQMSLVRYGDNLTVDLGRCSRVLVRSGKALAALGDSTEVAAAVRSRVLADSLFVLEAETRGLAETADFRIYMEETSSKILVHAARKRDVLSKVKVGADEIKVAYEQDRQRYQLPSQIQATEILTTDNDQAENLLGQILAGADMGRLAQQYSLRPGAQRSSGHIHFREGQVSASDSLKQRMRTAVVGELVGPVRVPDGYVIFRVEERQKAFIRPLDQVEHLVRFKIRKAKEKQAFEAYITHLREFYEGSVTWHDERLVEVGDRWDR